MLRLAETILVEFLPGITRYWHCVSNAYTEITTSETLRHVSPLSPMTGYASCILALFSEVAYLLVHGIKYQILTCTFSLCMVIFLASILIHYPLLLYPM